MPQKKSRLETAAYAIMALCLAGLLILAWLRDASPGPIRIAWLHPTFGAPDIWLAELDHPEAAQRLTHSEFGVRDFDVSADGKLLVYSEGDAAGYGKLRLLRLETGEISILLDCAALRANCANPRFNPAGDRLAYERDSQIWLLDLQSADLLTRPLIADEPVAGHSPVWSADGAVLGFYSDDHGEMGIMLVSETEGEAKSNFVPSAHGAMGALSPDGSAIVFPEIIGRGEKLYSYLRIADMERKTLDDFSDPEAAVNDVSARWHPAGEILVVARQYTDARWTAGHQLYLVEAAAPDGEWKAVAYDERYSAAYARWDANGERLLMQRLPLDAAGGQARPEVWVVELESGAARRLASDAYLPLWVGG